eukprot:970269-Prymnesium_polylepis.1
MWPAAIAPAAIATAAIAPAGRQQCTGELFLRRQQLERVGRERRLKGCTTRVAVEMLVLDERGVLGDGAKSFDVPFSFNGSATSGGSCPSPTLPGVDPLALSRHLLLNAEIDDTAYGPVVNEQKEWRPPESLWTGPELEVTGRDASLESVVLVASALQAGSKLEHLSISQGSAGDLGAIAIADAMHGNQILTDVDLSRNRIGAEGLKAISRMLAANRAMKRLNLCGNILTDYSHSHAGLAALAGALALNGTLTSLNIGSNDIRRLGCIAIADALRVNTKLEELHLASSQLCEENRGWR